MININIIDDPLIIKSINNNTIKNIFPIFKNTGEFKYATGIFGYVDYKQFYNTTSQFLLKDNVFFLEVCLLNSGQSVGFVKGSIVKNDQILWINSFAIDKPFQSKGIGKKVFYLVENYFKKELYINKVFLSVYKSNTSGMNFWSGCGFSECDKLYKEGIHNLSEYVQIMCKLIK